jgi:hypothetical protein
MSEEHFAPNANNSSDDESTSSFEMLGETVTSPVRRYVTQSQNATTIIKHLKEDNLKMIKDKLKKDESEQIRYLSLDNASKDVEILELKEEIEKYKSLLKPIKHYEEAFKLLDKNNEVYKSLIEKVSSLSYKELMELETEQIEIVVNVEHVVPDIEKSLQALESTFKNKKYVQNTNRDKFHEAIVSNASSSRRKLYFFMDTLFGLFILYNIFYFYLGK